MSWEIIRKNYEFHPSMSHKHVFIIFQHPHFESTQYATIEYFK